MESKQALAQTLSKIAIAGLAASTGPMGAMVGQGASEWIDRFLANWGKHQDYLQAAERQLLALIQDVDEAEGHIALETAVEAARKSAISLREFAELEYDPQKAAERVTERLGWHRLETDPLSQQLLVQVYQCFLEFKDHSDQLNLAFQQTALALLNRQQELSAELKAFVEQKAWTGLLQIPLESSDYFEGAPSRLLTAAFELLPYQARAQDAELYNWLNSERDLSIRTVTAAGGVGKTRWLIEHCQRLPGEWRAGFLQNQPPDPMRYANLFHEAEKLLIVIDYVEGRRQQFATLLDQAALTRPQGGHVRILLLTRNLDQQWWDSLRVLPAQANARGLIDAESRALDHIRLEPLLPIVSNRQSLFELARKQMERFIQEPSALQPLDLSAEFYQDPLFIQLAALNQLQGGESNLSAVILLETVLEHEKRYWQQFEQLDSEIVAPIMALITLWQGLPKGQLSGLITAWPDPDSVVKQVDPAKLAQSLALLYPDNQEGIAPLQPDRLGEALVHQVLSGTEKGALLEAAFSAEISTEPVLSAFQTIGRMTAWHPAENYLWAELFRDDPTTLERIAEQMRQSLLQNRDITLAYELLKQLPDQSLALVNLAADAENLILKRLENADQQNEAIQSQSARLKIKLSVRLAALGQREDALNAAQEAVELYRQLAKLRPDAFCPDLVGSLNNLANCHYALGQREAALNAAQEATDIRRQLCELRPDAFRPDLARNLNNLAIHLSELGQREAALNAAQEAVDLYRQLADLRPDAFRPDLISSLDTLGSVYLNAEQTNAAQSCFVEGLKLMTPLLQSLPQPFAPLSQSLQDYYLECCELLKQKPDKELLEPIEKVLKRLQGPQE